MAVTVIAIDGPSGSGKGTIARRVADALGFHLLDSGALYRLTAISALHQDVAFDDVARLAAVARDLDVAFESNDAGGERILLAGVDITRDVRKESTGALASRVAASALSWPSILPIAAKIIEISFAETEINFSFFRVLGTIR